jgi:hypothetical protein
LAFFLWRTKHFRMEVVSLAVAALATWAVAYLTLFSLFEPSRYIPYPLMVLWLLILPGTLMELFRLLKPWVRDAWPQVKLPSRRALNGAAILFVTLVTIATTALIAWRSRTGQGGMIGTAPPEVYTYLHTLPVNVKIAAHPMDANDIPMRSQRSVLAFSKAMWPYHHEFYEEIMARVDTTMKALYSTNYADILALRSRSGADVLVVNSAWYKKDPINAEPYNEMVKSCRNHLADNTPLVLRAPKEAILFEKGTFTVLDLAALEKIQKLN